MGFLRQALAEPTPCEFSDDAPLNPAPKSVINGMAGFEVVLAVPFLSRFSGLGLGGSANPGRAGFAASEPVITPMAGFAFLSRFHLPGGHISTPAPRR